jgi:hypothetical protein
MGKIEIYFLGLIAHVGDQNEATHAAIVLGKHFPHDSRIYFSNGQDQPIGQGEHVRIGAQNASAKKSVAFNTYVPSLELLCTTAVLKRDVINKTNQDDVKSFIGYPLGNAGLDVADRYHFGAIYVRPDPFRHEQCVARLTVVTLQTDAAITVYIGDRPYKVNPNEWLLIKNVSPNQDQDHFEEFKHLTDAMLIARPYANVTAACRYDNPGLDYLKEVQKYIGEPAAAEIECTNSKWP